MTRMHKYWFDKTAIFPKQGKVEVTFSDGSKVTGLLKDHLDDHFTLELSGNKELHIDAAHVRSIQKG